MIAETSHFDWHKIYFATQLWLVYLSTKQGGN